VAATALALGVGVNTALFSFADVVLNHPVALAQLDRLATIREQEADSGDYEPLTVADYLDLRTGSRSFERLAAYEYWGVSFGVAAHCGVDSCYIPARRAIGIDPLLALFHE
jgi:hypothetical protein